MAEILFDQDDVLNQFNEHLLENYNRKHQPLDDDNGELALELSHINHWGFWKSRPELLEVYDVALKNPDTYQVLRPMPGAVDGMRLLHEWGHGITVVTSIPEEAVGCFEAKKRWLARHIPWLSLRNEFIPTSAKWKVRGDVLVDDADVNIDECIRRGRHAIMFDRPWNESYAPPRDLAHLFRRAKDWVDLMKNFGPNGSLVWTP